MERIRLASPFVGQEEIDAVIKVIMSQKLNMGRETFLFEQELKKFLNNDNVYVCSVNSGTSAISLALSAHGIGYGDEVLVPSYTFIATFQAVASTGAKPIPCDVDLDDAFLDLCDAEKRISQKTKAVIPVFFAGCDHKIDRVHEFASHHSLKIVEDAAHSFGTDGIVDRGSTLCFSFDAIKNITCGDGGAIITYDKDMYDIMKDARLLGVIGDTEVRFEGKRSWDFDAKFQGFRCHMNAIAASIGRSQLAKFDIMKQKRRRFASMYMSGLSHLEDFVKLLPIDTKRVVPHIFPIIIKNEKRDDLREFLAENWVESGIQYKPNHMLSYFYLGYNLVNSEKLYKSMLSIPLHPRLKDVDVERVISLVNEFFLKK